MRRAQGFTVTLDYFLELVKARPINRRSLTNFHGNAECLGIDDTLLRQPAQRRQHHEENSDKAKHLRGLFDQSVIARCLLQSNYAGRREFPAQNSTSRQLA
jgi:hypothetical protein